MMANHRCCLPRPASELFPGALVVLVVGAVLVGGLRSTVAEVMTPTAVRLRWLHRGLLAVAVAYGGIALSVLAIGPWRVSGSLINASASSVAKPLTVMALAVALALLLSSTLRAAARRGSVMGFYLVAALFTWLLTLGPTIVAFSSSTEVPGPYRLLAMLPFVDGLRAPGRFWMMTALCLAVVTGIYVAKLLGGRSRRTVVVALTVFTSVLLVDSLNRIVAAPLPPPVPNPQTLAGEVVIELPVGGGRDIAAQWRALEADAISVNGFSGYEPAYYQSLITAVELADAAGLRPFLRDRDLHVIVDVAFPLLAEMVESQPGAVLIASNAWARQYRIARQGGRAAEAGLPIPIVAVQSACAREGDPPSAAIDGDPTTTWICPPMNTPMELTMDLGVARSVAAFRQHLGQYTWHMPRAMTIETSLDGVAWTVAYEGSVLDAAIDSALAAPRAASLLLSFEPREARYLRVRGESQLRDFHFTMAEAEVYAPR